jgi:hypothetical protein
MGTRRRRCSEWFRNEHGFDFDDSQLWNYDDELRNDRFDCRQAIDRTP